MHLIAVAAAALGQRPVVAHRDREEVVHQVRVLHLVVAAHEAAGLEVVRRAGATLAEQPLQPDQRPPLHREIGRHRHGLAGLVLDVDLEVVLEVLPHPGQVRDDVDPERAELAGGADAGQLKQLRRVDRAAADDHLARVHRAAAAPAAAVLHAGRARALEHDPRGERARLDLEVLAPHHRVQVGAGGRQPLAVVHVAVERREALLAIAVHVLGERVARLLDGLEERVEERPLRRPAFEHERSVVAAEGIVRRRRQAVLHPLEVRKAVRVVPGLHPVVGGPALVVHRVAALEDHPVDRARPAEHLPARVVDPAAAHVRLRLGLVLPVVEAAADRERERRRHVDEDVPRIVGAARLQHEHARARVRRQPVRQRAAGRPSAHDHEVVARVHVSILCALQFPAHLGYPLTEWVPREGQEVLDRRGVSDGDQQVDSAQEQDQSDQEPFIQ